MARKRAPIAASGIDLASFPPDDKETLRRDWGDMATAPPPPGSLTRQTQRRKLFP